MPRIGNTVGGKYVLQEEIGEGSMGSVWKAVHQTLGRPFAVKFLKSYGINAERLEQRFFQEARLAAAVQHRFVVSIVDFGLTDEGTPYMAMEFLQGEPLSRRLRHGPPFSVREAVRIVAQALVGLEAVHQAGVVHRDLKPENIVLVAEAGGMIPKLVDFGISRPEISTTATADKLTAPGIALGTPWYMSPEQVRGRKDIDRRTDLYSMGVILYEALSGRLPYDDEDQMALLKKVAAGRPEPLLAVRPELGPFISAIVERAMMLDPGRRFSNASEMAAALFSVAQQVPEALACPMRAHDAGTDPQGKSLDPIVPPESEISSEILALSTTISPPPRFGRRRTLMLVGGGLAAAAAVLLLVTRGAPHTAGRVRPVASTVMPAIEPLPAPSRPPPTPAPPPPAPTRAVHASEQPSPRRDRDRRKGRRHGEKAAARASAPPEAFTNPGF